MFILLVPGLEGQLNYWLNKGSFNRTFMTLQREKVEIKLILAF